MNDKVPFREVLSDLWADLSSAQKFVTIALILGGVGVVIASWVNTFQAWSEIRVYERQAVKAEQEKNEALDNAAKIASGIKVKEEELLKVEVKKDAKRKEVEQAKRDVDRDRAEYDHAVVSRRADIPSTDDVCASLASVGHPCYPN